MSFSQSRDFSVGAYSFTNIHGDAHNYHIPPAMDPLAMLRNASAMEATHASKTASYAPKCRPGSRAEVIKDIMNWIPAEDTGAVRGQGELLPDGWPVSLIWFQGPAGGGKTCIMREVVSQCEAKGYTVASYFFSTRVPGLDSEEPFVATIAHQLAAGKLQPPILEAISSVPDIFDQSLERQAHCLLVGPLLAHSNHGRIVVVLDGLDECRGAHPQKQPSERVHLISLLRTLATSISGLRIIIASRPEFDIRTTFASPHYAPITRTLRLQNYDGTSEIRDYFCDEFCRIRETHPAKDFIDPAWPAESTINILVHKSSGSYIYPSTVVKHVSNPRSDPIRLLEEVLSLRPSHSNPLAELDSLYNHILHPPDIDIPLLRRILHCLIVLTNYRSFDIIGPKIMDEFLSLPLGTTVTALCDLHSLISIPTANDSDKEPLLFFHKTLEDYLIDRGRSGNLWQPVQETQAGIITRCIFHINRWSESLTRAQTLEEPSSRPTQMSSLPILMHIYHTFLMAFPTQNIPTSALLPVLNSFNPTTVWKLRVGYFYQHPHHRWPQTDPKFLDMSNLSTPLHSLCLRGTFGRIGGKPICHDLCATLLQLTKLDPFVQDSCRRLPMLRAGEQKGLHAAIARLERKVLTYSAESHLPMVSFKHNLPTPSPPDYKPFSIGEEVPRTPGNGQRATTKVDASSSRGGQPSGKDPILPPKFKLDTREKVPRKTSANGLQPTLNAPKRREPSANGLSALPVDKSEKRVPPTATRQPKGHPTKPSWRI